MGKQKEQEATTWQGKMKEFGGGNFTFLSSDGETITFIVVGLPILIKSVYQKKEQERIGCPVVTEDGYVLFICGKRVARKIAKFERHFYSSAIMVTRHGAEGDVNSKYDVRLVPEPETFTHLKAIMAEEFTPDMVDESVQEASQVMSN